LAYASIGRKFIHHQSLSEAVVSDTEPSKNQLALKAFGDAVEDIVREVSRSQPTGIAGAKYIMCFLDLINDGAGVVPVDLAAEALSRIEPPERPRRKDTDITQYEALLSVARASAGLMIELAATDAAAGSRRVRSERKLRAALDEFVAIRGHLPR
jgi:hypothetical protein